MRSMKLRLLRSMGCLAALVAASALHVRAASAQNVVVSITFDDAIDDTVTDDGPATSLDNIYPMASSLLTDGDLEVNEALCPNVGSLGSVPQFGESLDCDVPATYFLNSPRIDESKFFSLQQVRELDAMGHEIGGHSAHHLEIPKLESASESILDLDEQGLQVCWDRQRLSLIPKLYGGGTLEVTSFAYPFGENAWSGDPALIARFGTPAPALLGDETHGLVGQVSGKCAYRSARTTLGAANTPECVDRDPATPCVWAESTLPPNPFALRVPSSVNYKMPIDYPVVPVNDDGNGIYDRVEEFESRADTVKGWIDNAIANPASTGKNWITLTFHSICFAYRCNQYGIEYHEFANLLTWLRQKRQAGEIQLSTIRQVLKQTKEYRVTVPPIPEQAPVVRNEQLAADINRDHIPDCFDSAGTGVFESGLAIGNPIHADADDNSNGIADDGFGGDRWYGWLLMAGGTSRGRFFTRMDLGHCTPTVTSGSSYRLSFRYRKPSTARHCGFAEGADQAPCPLDVTDQAPSGRPPNYYLIYAFRHPVGVTSAPLDDASWTGFSRVLITPPTTSGWAEASAVVTAPLARDAIAMGIEIEHDDADGRVDVDIDNFNYCRLSSDNGDAVAPCP
jgi:hypothetical protein